MKRWVFGVGSMIVAVSTAWGAAPQFPSAVFAQTIRGRSLGATGFPWPSMASFRSAWDEAQKEVRWILVADVRLSNGESALLELRARPDQHTSVDVITTESRDGYYEARRLVSGRWPVETSDWKAGKTLSLTAGDREASVEVVRVSEPGTPAGQALYDDWTYLSVLLEEGHAKEGEFVIPMGACSMDTSPQIVAREHAQTCFDQGRIGCYLEFQIRVMGNQFSRVAYSSRGERIASTHAEELLDTGLDLTRFARGLSAQYSTPEPRRAELGDWRFGRALVELGDPAVESAMEAVARASDVDEYNRLRATIIIAFTEVARARSEDRDIAGDEIALAVQTRLGSMSWSAQRWLDLFAKAHDN